MAVFDLERQRMCVRIVYDGIASAGKTTNLRQLCELFATQHKSSIESPEELRGRTLYFDWVQIAAGMVCGFPLLCQVITVPGQVVLNPRRREILASADVVIYVCNSSRAAVDATCEGLGIFRRLESEMGRNTPLVLQANKQDQADALSGAALARAVEIPTAAHVEAIASEGIGVVDTFVTAVRAIVRSIQQRVERDALRIQVKPSERKNALLGRLRQIEIEPNAAAEMILTEALASIAIAEPARPIKKNREPKIEAPQHRPPPLPTENVPTGFIWPAHTGRATLQALGRDGALDETSPVGESGVVVHRVGQRVLRTSLACRYSDSETARQALVKAARERTQLAPILLSESVLVVTGAADNASWLWTVTSVAEPLVDWMRSSAASDPVLRQVIFGSLAHALIEGAALASKHGLSCDLSLAQFGVHQRSVVYIGEIASARASERDVGDFIAAAATELAHHGIEIEPFLRAIEREITERTSASDIAKIEPAVRTARSNLGMRREVDA